MNALQAKELADNANRKKEKSWDSLVVIIKKAAAEGHFKCHLKNDEYLWLQNKLKAEGYAIEKNWVIDEDYFTIYWK